MHPPILPPNLPPIPRDARDDGPSHPAGPSFSAPLSSGRKHRRRGFVIAGFCLLVLFCTCMTFLAEREPAEDPVMRWKPDVQAAARQYGIDDHLNELMAILEVESGGQGEDIFQSSESLGLSPNSLTTDESINQGVAFYASLLQEAHELGVDRDSVYQAYNYGRGYLQYVADHGGVHTQELAEQFASEQAHGETVPYPNPIALEYNGGWRYNYGNMFYVSLVHQALDSQRE